MADKVSNPGWADKTVGREALNKASGTVLQNKGGVKQVYTVPVKSVRNGKK